MYFRLITFIALMAASLSASSVENCVLTPAQEQKLLSLSYNDFDQTPIGWRLYAKQGCYKEMALIIDKYLEQHKKELADWQVIAVRWHAGQMYAFTNQYDKAAERFQSSINPNEPANSPILWNAYVRATLAFLNKNMAQLQYYRDEIANGPVMNGEKANLKVVDKLIEHFGEPYSVAYCYAE